MIWYHDGIFTGRSLVYESQDLTSIATENAVMAFYIRSPEFLRNSDMPCGATALTAQVTHYASLSGFFVFYSNTDYVGPLIVEYKLGMHFDWLHRASALAISLFFYKYGARIRAHSKFAPCIVIYLLTWYCTAFWPVFTSWKQDLRIAADLENDNNKLWESRCIYINGSRQWSADKKNSAIRQYKRSLIVIMPESSQDLT